MKKFRMMLPMVAFVFAVAGAVAGDILPGIQAYYRVGTSGCSTVTKLTDQDNCSADRDSSYPTCTVTDGVNHPQAFANNLCTQPLRYISE